MGKGELELKWTSRLIAEVHLFGLFALFDASLN